MSHNEDVEKVSEFLSTLLRGDLAKALSAGLSVVSAAQRLNVSVEAVKEGVKKYLQKNGEQAVDFLIDAVPEHLLRRAAQKITERLFTKK